MIKRDQLRGLFALGLLTLSTFLNFFPILIIGLFKLIPIKPWQAFCTRCVDKVAMVWNHINNAYIDRAKLTKWKVTGLENLDRKQCYLVVANHQSWLDIVILQRLFHRRIPVLKFFIKDQLKWVPLLGFAWWAMGCPFMKRYSREHLEKYPHKKGKDLQSTQKSLELFRYTPVSIMNFVEGTRFSDEKSKEQHSPYQYLLKPKAGGLKMVINSMGEQFSSLLDVTIVYPHEKYSLWNFLCRRIEAITVHIRQLPIPAQFCDPSLDNEETTRGEFSHWLNQHWLEKDQLIKELRT